MTGDKAWSFLTNRTRALVRLAQDPAARLRDIATTVGITKRSAYAIVTDLSRGIRGQGQRHL